MTSAELFSKVSRRMWRDEKFVELSAPPPNARDLWVYLLTGPHNGTIPGIFVLGELALAEDMEWDPGPTRACLEEILAKGMARFDRKRRLFWLPNAIVHNLPRSPKQVTGWAKAWKLLPECALLTEASTAIRAQLAAKSPKFAEAFDRVVAGMAESPESEALDEEDDVSPPTSPSAGNRAVETSLSHRGSGFYPIEPAVSMRFQEKEQEKEKEMSPSETTTARARGAAAVGRGSSVTGRPALTVAAELARSPVAESDEERAILQFLLASPPLRQIATDAFACHVAVHCAEGPHTGRLRLEDILHALDAAGRAEALQSAAAGIPRDQRQLAAYVMGFVKKTRLGDGARAAAAEAAQDGVAATEFLERFDAAWSKAKGDRVRAHASGDVDHATRVVELAQQASCRSGSDISAAEVQNHWIREHLRSQDRLVVEADHALRLLPGRVDTYGLPRKSRKVRPVAVPASPPARGTKPPPEIAMGNVFGRVDLAPGRTGGTR